MAKWRLLWAQKHRRIAWLMRESEFMNLSEFAGNARDSHEDCKASVIVGYRKHGLHVNKAYMFNSLLVCGQFCPYLSCRKPRNTLVLIALLKLGNRAFSSNPGAQALSKSSVLLNCDWVGNTFLSNLEIRFLRDVGYWPIVGTKRQ